MTRSEFNIFLAANDARASASSWCGQAPDATPLELWQQCERPDWMLWLCKEMRVEIPIQFIYECANSAMSYAVTELDSVGVQHNLRWVITADAAYAAALATAIAARATDAADAAVRSRQADRLRHCIPDPFQGTDNE